MMTNSYLYSTFPYFDSAFFARTVKTICWRYIEDILPSIGVLPPGFKNILLVQVDGWVKSNVQDEGRCIIGNKGGKLRKERTGGQRIRVVSEK